MKLYKAVVLTVLLTAAGRMSAHELPMMFQERYLFVTGSVDTEAPWITDPGISAFSGDFPLVIHKGFRDLSLYSGVPLYIPLYISLGLTNQVGYYDAYRESTLISQISAGWRTPSMDQLEGPFIAWGFRHGGFAGGASYHFFHQIPTAYFGVSTALGGTSLEISTEGIEASVNLRTSGNWSAGVSVSRLWDGDAKISLGLGISRRDYPSHFLERDKWDMRIAHRGSMEHAPENSMSALKYALNQPRFDAIEVDVQRTVDGEFVLVHDPVLIRYTRELKFVPRMTYEELKARDFGSWFDEEFAGEQILHLKDLAELAETHRDMYWFIEIKSYDWSEEDVIDFLAQCDALFPDPEKIVFYTLNHRLLDIMQKHTERPVGLQLDSRKFMLFLSDHLLPLTKWEYRKSIGEKADFFTIISSKYDRKNAVKQTADDLGIPVLFWDFHDDMYGYIPNELQEYPLGIPKIQQGRIFPAAAEYD